jgi:hypothetical protein
MVCHQPFRLSGIARDPDHHRENTKDDDPSESERIDGYPKQGERAPRSPQRLTWLATTRMAVTGSAAK